MSSGWSVIAVRYGTLETTRSEAYYRYQSYGEPDGRRCSTTTSGSCAAATRRSSSTPVRSRRRARAWAHVPDRARRGDGGPGGRPRDGLARGAHPSALRPHGQPRPFPDAELLVAARDLDFGSARSRGARSSPTPARRPSWATSCRPTGGRTVLRLRGGDGGWAPGVDNPAEWGDSPSSILLVDTATSPVILGLGRHSLLRGDGARLALLGFLVDVAETYARLRPPPRAVRRVGGAVSRRAQPTRDEERFPRLDGVLAASDAVHARGPG